MAEVGEGMRRGLPPLPRRLLPPQTPLPPPAEETCDVQCHLRWHCTRPGGGRPMGGGGEMRGTRRAVRAGKKSDTGGTGGEGGGEGRRRTAEKGGGGEKMGSGAKGGKDVLESLMAPGIFVSFFRVPRTNESPHRDMRSI
jgi:hypothetical protein